MSPRSVERIYATDGNALYDAATALVKISSILSLFTPSRNLFVVFSSFFREIYSQY